MGARVGGERTEGKPTPVQLAWRPVDEAAHIVAPEREARQPEREAGPKRRSHP